MSEKDNRFFGVVIDVKVLLVLATLFILGYLFINNNGQNVLQNTQSDSVVKQDVANNGKTSPDNAVDKTLQNIKDSLKSMSDYLKNTNSNTKPENKNNKTSQESTSSTQDPTSNSVGYGFDTGNQDINTGNIQVAGQEASTDNTLQPTYEGGSSVDQYTGFTAPDETVYFEGGIVDDGTTDAIVNPGTNLIPSNEQVNCVPGTEGCYEVLPDPIVPIVQ